MTWIPKNPAPAPNDFQNNDLYLKSKIKLADSTSSLCFNLFWTSKWTSYENSSLEKVLAFFPEPSSSEEESSISLYCFIFKADIY